MGKRIVGVRRRGKKSFEIRYYGLDGKRQHETVAAITAEAAAKIRESRLGDLARGIPVSSGVNRVRFNELCADVLTNYRANNHRSISHIETRFRLHVDPYFGHFRAAQITTGHIDSYIVARRTEEATIGTVNRELEAIRRAFSLGYISGKIIAKPHVPKLREDNVRKGFFTVIEMEAICRVLPAAIASIVRFAFLTGWRLSEIRNLEWRNVFFDEDEIRLDPGTTKNDEGRTFPITNEMFKLLNAQKPKRGDFPGPRVFLWNQQPIGEFRKTWKTACAKAGLTGRLFHDLRRSAVRELVRTYGLSEREAMTLTGHKTRSVFDRYSVVSKTDLDGIRAKLNGGKNGGNSPRKLRKV